MKIIYITCNVLGKQPGIYRKELSFDKNMHEICKRINVLFTGYNIYLDKEALSGNDKDSETTFFVTRKIDSRLYRIFQKIKYVRSIFRGFALYHVAYGILRKTKADIIILREIPSIDFPWVFNPEKVLPRIRVIVD